MCMHLYAQCSNPDASEVDGTTNGSKVSVVASARLLEVDKTTPWAEFTEWQQFAPCTPCVLCANVTCAAASLSTTTILAAPRAIPALLAIPTTLLPASVLCLGCIRAAPAQGTSPTFCHFGSRARRAPGPSRASGALLHPRRGCRVLGLPGPYRARDIALTFGLFPFTRHPSPGLELGPVALSPCSSLLSIVFYSALAC